MEETKDGLTRRSFLGTTAIGAIGLAAAGFGAGAIINPKEAHAAALVFPQPTALDVEKIRNLGYYWYKKGPGCGHGSARALIQGFHEACVAQGIDPGAWADLPRNLYAWCNGGGPNSWGALCGSIAGSVGVLNLIMVPSGASTVPLVNILGSSVYEWYVKQSFPLANLDAYPAGFDGGSGATAAPIPDGEVKGHAVSDSPLCHISVSKWLAAAGVQHGQLDSLGRDMRSDRCAKVTADTAAYTAFLYNEYKAGRSPAAWAKPAAMAGCFDCHDPAGTTGVTNKSSATKMDCLPCHTEPVSGRK